MQKTEFFSASKIKKSVENFNIFQIFAQNIDCGYMLRVAWLNEYLGIKLRKIVYPVTPQFYNIKVGFKGVYISWICFRDDLLYCMNMFLMNSV